MRPRHAALTALCLVVLVLWASPRPARAGAVGVLVVDFDTQVDAGAVDFVHHAADTAIANQLDILIRMNTPGGLLDSMESIIQEVQRVQSNGYAVYTWVPPAAWAASAGSYIALASNKIYMGNGSFIGPSTPYVSGGTALEQQHVQNAMITFIGSLAQSNGYNVSAAKSMASDNVAFTATEAASVGLVTGLADTRAGVLSLLGLSGLPATDYGEPIVDRFLSFISNPLVDGLFILAGMVALVLDLFHRTLVLTVVALILIVLGFFGAELINAPIVAIVLLVLAAALIFVEVKAGHGMFATAGIVMGLVGTYLLVYGVRWSPSPFGWAQYVVLGIVAAVMVVGFIYLAKIRRSLKLQPKLVDPGLVVNKTGRAATDLAPGRDGVVNVGSEDYTAVSDAPIEKGASVRVTAYEDGKVRVVAVPPAAPAGDASSSAQGN